VAVGAVPILLIVVYSLLIYAEPEWHLQPLARPWGALAVGLPIVVFLYGVISDAIQFHRDRTIGSSRAVDD
jgi:hypothetical protein